MKIVVMGSAHLDIIAEATSGRGTVDRPGVLRIHVGGTAYNLAVNLAKLGASITFCSAFNRSAISAMIIAELDGAGVNVIPQYDERLPDSGFSAHTESGEIYSAVTSAAVERHTFDDSLIHEMLAGAQWVCMDANLSAATLSQITRIALKMGVPSSLQLVSEEKALRICEVHPQPDMVFGNHREHSFLVSHGEGWEAADDKLIFVTNGSRKALVYQGQAVAASAAPEQVDGDVNALGAGDAFSAGAVLYMAKTPAYDLKGAIIRGHSAAAQVLRSANCNFGEHEVLNRTLGELNQRAHHDNLTKLLNRDGAALVFAELKKEQREYSLIFMDIDHFKIVNDTHGHDIGDRALVFIANTLRDAMREGDYVFRFGGEEFVVALPGASVTKAMEIANRLVEKVRESTPPAPLTGLTISGGVACNSGNEDADVTIRLADEALYESKHSGRDRVSLNAQFKGPSNNVSPKRHLA